MKIAVVRIRGSVNVPSELRRMLDQLGLERPNNVVVLEDTDTYLGMLQKIRHLVTYGQPSQAILEFLLRKRGDVRGFGKLTDKYMSDQTNFDSIAAFAQALSEDKVKITDVPMLKRTFRCSPPSRGYETVKRSFSAGGSLGDRGAEINKLLKRMI
jgi:large subunit ribosomal protein L30